MGPAGAAALGRALAKNRRLAELLIYRNPGAGTGVGADGLAAGLAENRTLEWLELTSCGVDAAGAAALARALSGGANRTLARLSLAQNPGIGRDGALALAAALRTNKGLTSLLLKGSGVWRHEGFREALAAAVRANSSLVSLGADCREMGAEDEAALLAALQENRSLVLMSGTGHSIQQALGANMDAWRRDLASRSVLEGDECAEAARPLIPDLLRLVGSYVARPPGPFAPWLE